MVRAVVGVSFSQGRSSMRKIFASLVLLLVFGGAVSLRAQNLSSLAELPDYRELDGYQETMTREEFTGLLEKLYAPHGGWEAFVRIDPGAAVIRKTSVPLDDLYTLRFAPNDAGQKPLPARYWRPRALVPVAESKDKPLTGLRVALDPGHLGGRWAKLEERWFQIGDAPPVMEGEMTLKVAQALAERLRALGATAELVRASDEPSTPLRPADLTGPAREQLAESGCAASARDLRRRGGPAAAVFRALDERHALYPGRHPGAGREGQ